MITVLQLFPARVRFVDQEGRLTPEAGRALQILFERVGGAIGASTDIGGGLMAMFAIDAPETPDYMPGPQGMRGEQGATGPAIGMLATDESNVEFVPGPPGQPGRDGQPGPALFLLQDGGDGDSGVFMVAPTATAEASITPTFTNSWVNYSAGFADASYYKDQFGIVHLCGLIKSGVMGSAAFTLPAGYFPAARELFGTMSDSSIGRLDVLANGECIPITGTNNWFSLSGISFRAA